MTDKTRKIILCVLEEIKYQVDLAPKNKSDIKKILEKDRKEGVVQSVRSIMMNYPNLGVRLITSGVRDKCGINSYEIENVLGKIKEAKAIYEFRPVSKLGYFQILISPRFNKFYQTIDEIDENPWLPKESKITQTKKILEKQQKQFGKNIEPKIKSGKNKTLTKKSESGSKIEFPSDPEVIEEYLCVINQIKKERQRTPNGEPIAYPVSEPFIASGVPMPEQETLILRKLEQDGIVEIAEKTIPIYSPYDPYDNSETIRAVIIPNLKKFENYLTKLLELQKKLKKSDTERETNAKKTEIHLEKLHEKQTEQTTPKELFAKDVINVPTLAEIEEKARQEMAPIKEYYNQERLLREQFKQQRILDSRKEDKKIHTLDTIIEHIEPYYPEQKNISIDYHYFNFENRMVDSKLFEKFLDEVKKQKGFKDFNRANYSGGTEFGFIEVNIDKLKEYREKIIKENKQKPIALKFKITVKDREIWINNYFLSKPHAVGTNFEFFEYIRSQPANTEIKWSEIPNTVGYELMKKAIEKKRFIKILNAIGFKGEIKKSFFYKVGKNTLYYKGDEIVKKDLEKAGVKIPLFLKQLEVAHIKNSPV